MILKFKARLSPERLASPYLLFVGQKRKVVPMDVLGKYMQAYTHARTHVHARTCASTHAQITHYNIP